MWAACIGGGDFRCICDRVSYLGLLAGKLCFAHSSQIVVAACGHGLACRVSRRLTNNGKCGMRRCVMLALFVSLAASAAAWSTGPTPAAAEEAKSPSPILA